MASPPRALLDAIAALVAAMPEGAIAPLAQAIADLPPGAWAALRSIPSRVLAAPQYRAQIGAFLSVWEREAPLLPPASVALALEAAGASVRRERRAQTLELVWTGPASPQPLRRTAQVLQELIDGAQRDLLIVSYAVYDIPETRAALLRALDRGVHLRLVIESPKESDGRMAYDGLLAFGPAVRSRATVYRWPAEQRPTDNEGRPGSLHAKCAIADRDAMLITSANLTHYALSLNMELGLLVRGGTLPHQVTGHFEELMHARVLVNIAESD